MLYKVIGELSTKIGYLVNFDINAYKKKDPASHLIEEFHTNLFVKKIIDLLK